MINFIVNLELFTYIGSLSLLFGILLCSSLVIKFASPVHKLLALMLVFFLTAISWINLDAEFLAFTMLLLYVAAIIMLFLISLMILQVEKHHEKTYLTINNFLKLKNFMIWLYFILSIILTCGLLAIFIYSCKDYRFSITSNFANNNLEVLAKHLSNNYLLIFASAGLLLLAGMLVIMLILGVTNTKHNRSIELRTNKQSRLKLLELR